MSGTEEPPAESPESPGKPEPIEPVEVAPPTTREAPESPEELAARSLRRRSSSGSSGSKSRRSAKSSKSGKKRAGRSGKSSPSRQQPRWRRPSTWIVGTLVVVLVVPLLYVGYLLHIVDGIQRAPLLPTFDGPQGRGTNILLLASQKDESRLRVDRDSLLIQLVHISGDRRSAAVIHFPRELALEPEPGQKRRTLVSMHEADGAAGIANLLQQRLKLRINHVAQVDFTAYVEATDRLGGVDLTDDQAGKLSGTQVLDWTSGEESEVLLGRRQQDWERALLREGLQPRVVLNPIKLVGLLHSLADHTLLDETFTNRAVRSLAWQSRRMTPANVIFFTAPVADLKQAVSAPAGARIRPDTAGITRLGEVLAVDNTAGIASFDN